MRLWTATIVMRLKDDGEPDASVDLDIEDGVPGSVLDTIGPAIENIGRQVGQQLLSGDIDSVTERG